MRRFKPFRVLSKNPVLKAFFIDFNQHIRFTYIVKNLGVLLRSVTSQETIFTTLDVGAGIGILSDYLRGEFAGFIVNAEISSKRKLSNLVVANGSRLPFRDNSFDFLVSSDVLEHIEYSDRVDFVKELLRCCKFGIVITYSKVHKDNPSPSGIKIFENLCHSFPDWYLEHNRKKIVDENALINILNENGAQVTELKPLTGIFALFFTGMQYLLSIRLLVFLLNITGYLATRLLDPPPYYSFGVTALKRKL